MISSHFARATLPVLLLAVLVLTAPPARAIDRLRYQPYPQLNGKPVRRVLILGNRQTADVVFRREMTLAEGVTFSSSQLWRDWENLVDLGLFANIEVDAVPSGNGVLVVVSVHERPRWFASPTFDYQFSGNELTVGYRLTVRNISGMNQTLFSDGRIGGRDSFNFVWFTPWVGASRRSLGMQLNLELPQEGVDELRSNRISLFSTRFLGDYRKLRRGLTYFTRLEILDRDGTSPEGPLRQLSPAVGAGLSWDSRNVRIDPSRGSLFSLTTEYATGWTTNELSFLRGFGDARRFVSVGKRFVVAGRVNSILTTGRVPRYRRVGVGGAGSIRGQPGGVRTGVNLARGSLEVRFGLIGKRRFGLPIPLAPRRVRNFDLRFDGVLFTDAGTAWGDPGDDLGSARVRYGWGVGIRIFLPVLEVARLEIAFDEDGRPTLYFREGNLI